jgi:hypothetical protein
MDKVWQLGNALMHAVHAAMGARVICCADAVTSIGGKSLGMLELRPSNMHAACGWQGGLVVMDSIADTC